MNSKDQGRQQAAAGLEQLAALVRAQSWRNDATPSMPPTQASVLRILDASPQGLRAQHLAQRIGVSAASLSDSLKALGGKGWIVRDPDPADARASLVRLTRQGSATALALRDAAAGIGSLMKKLDREDLGAFLRVTQLLVHEAQQQGLVNGPRTCLGCRFFRPYAGDETGKPHFCDFVQQSFGDAELRTDCGEQEPAGARQLASNAARFRHANSP